MPEDYDTPKMIRAAVDEMARANGALSFAAWSRISSLFLAAADEIELLRKTLGDTARREASANAKLKRIQN